MNKEAYYFSHDANARHDDKILELRAEFGWEGYGLFWAIVETLRDCSDYAYPSNAKAGLALSLNIDKTKLEQFLKAATKLKLFVEKDGVIYSESLMRRMGDIDEKRRKRAEAGRLGGTAKAKAKQSFSNAKAKASKESKVKESKEKEINYSFEVFWDAYKKKEGKKEKVKAIWEGLKDLERETIITGLPNYLKLFEQPGRESYHPYPQTFLNGRYWENDSFTKVQTTPLGKPNNVQPNTSLSREEFLALMHS